MMHKLDRHIFQLGVSVGSIKTVKYDLYTRGEVIGRLSGLEQIRKDLEPELYTRWTSLILWLYCMCLELIHGIWNVSWRPYQYSISLFIQFIFLYLYNLYLHLYISLFIQSSSHESIWTQGANKNCRDNVHLHIAPTLIEKDKLTN